MKNQLSVFMALTCTLGVLSCKPKTIEKSGHEKSSNLVTPDQMAIPESKVSEVVTKPVDVLGIGEGLDIMDLQSTSFDKLDQEMMDALALLTPPKTRRENDVIEALYFKTLERKKELLFSVPVTPQAQIDLEEAWNTLETTGFFDNNQNRYVRDLILRYSEAPKLEKLAIWRLIRLRMESGLKRGSGAAEEALRIELARFLLSALEIDKQELFEAMNLKTRSLSEAAGRKGNQAEEEIVRIYSEQSDKAERILENHFKQSP